MVCLNAKVVLWTQENSDVHYANVEPPVRSDADPDPYPTIRFNGMKLISPPIRLGK